MIDDQLVELRAISDVGTGAVHSAVVHFDEKETTRQRHSVAAVAHSRQSSIRIHIHLVISSFCRALETVMKIRFEYISTNRRKIYPLPLAVSDSLWLLSASSSSL